MKKPDTTQDDFSVFTDVDSLRQIEREVDRMRAKVLRDFCVAGWNSCASLVETLRNVGRKTA